jgi:hypothetical protein
MTLIDLDRSPELPAPPPGPAGPRRTRRAAFVAGLLLAAATGAVVSHQWQEQRWQDARDSAVSMVVLSDRSGWAPERVEGYSFVDGRTVGVSMTGHVAVVNAGPAPVTVQRLSATGSGLSLHSTSSGSVTAPGAVAKFAVEGHVGCPAGGTFQKLAATVWVETADRVSRRTTVVFDGHAWLSEVRAACAARLTDIRFRGGG